MTVKIPKKGMALKGVVDSSSKEGECGKQALRLLAYRDRSEKEMREALQKRGHGASEIERVMDYLKEKRYIDDARYSRSWAEYRMESTPVGPLKLEADLRKKGFDETIVADISEGIWSRYSEFDIALRLARKRYIRGDDLPSAPVLRKVHGFLYRRGFSGEVAWQVLEELRK